MRSTPDWPAPTRSTSRSTPGRPAPTRSDAERDDHVKPLCLSDPPSASCLLPCSMPFLFSGASSLRLPQIQTWRGQATQRGSCRKHAPLHGQLSQIRNPQVVLQRATHDPPSAPAAPTQAPPAQSEPPLPLSLPPTPPTTQCPGSVTSPAPKHPPATHPANCARLCPCPYHPLSHLP